MTAIVAVTDGRDCVMACDSRVSDDRGVYWDTSAPKAVRVGSWLIGAAGDAGACRALMTRREMPPPPRRRDQLVAWAQAELWRSLDVEGDWIALLAARGTILLAATGGVIEPVGRGWHAIGSGGDIALGSLYATQDGPLSLYERAVLAVSAAAECNCTVGGEIRTVRHRHR